MSKLPQSTSELASALAEQLAFLRRSAAAYDVGYKSESKRMAATIRVLLHEMKNSKALLGLLGRGEQRFLSTARRPNPHNLLTHNGLVSMRVTAGAGAEYVALLDSRPPGATGWVALSNWWNEVVVVDDRRHTLDRRKIVLAAANQDGGAHVDPSLDEDYARLTRHNSMAWNIIDGPTEVPLPNVGPATLRQIAHEVLRSITPKGEDVFRAFPRLGRNEACFCGSGKKTKKCHAAA